jgi:hypothetical protein
MQLNLFLEAQKTTSTPTQPMKSAPSLSAALRQNTTDIDAALQNIFKSSQEETRMQQARRIMGAAVDCLSDEELEVCLTEFQHLLDEWLDTFEQNIFDGQTLKQVLGQG